MPTEKEWNKTAADLLVGRKVKAVRYMSKKEADQYGWNRRSLVIEFDNGLTLVPSADDEGNDAGALFTSDEDASVLPVMW